MMNMQIDQLVKTLLQKDTLDQCSLQELERFADRHPYFGAAQLLLTKKLQAEQPEKYDEQLQKTLLFFHNPLWVEHLLNGGGEATVIQPAKKETPAETITAPIVEVAAPASTENTGIISAPSETEQTVEPPVAEVQPAPIISIDIPVEAAIATTENTEAITETVPVEEPTELPEVETADAELETLQPKTENREPITLSQPETENPKPITLSQPETQNPKPITLSQETIIPSMPEDSIDIPTLPAIEASNTSNDLIFEPYHTVDYFASQGIKFREEEKPKDRFGQQLKSFTDWLKSMKKLPVTELTKGFEPKTEQKVEQMAQKSITEREVVTEAMAEVWEKQGNNERAIAIYTKLSLLEPSKSPYFAAKIDELKKKN